MAIYEDPLQAVNWYHISAGLASFCSASSAHLILGIFFKFCLAADLVVLRCCFSSLSSDVFCGQIQCSSKLAKPAIADYGKSYQKIDIGGGQHCRFQTV